MLNTNTVYFDKCENLFPLLEENSINLVVTSPPYATATSYGDSVDIFSADYYPYWFIPIIEQIYRVLTEDGSFILNINDITYKSHG